MRDGDDAYRPLLLLLFAAGVALFGFADFGIVVPVLAASLVATGLVYLFAWKLIDRRAAVWCGLLYACQPFNVVNSTTMTNDVILSCLAFASAGMLLIADRATDSWATRSLFAGAATMMIAAFLVKMTVAPALLALAAYSVASMRHRPSTVLRGHVFFHGVFVALLSGGCLVYYARTGDALWQFRMKRRAARFCIETASRMCASWRRSRGPCQRARSCMPTCLRRTRCRITSVTCLLRSI